MSTSRRSPPVGREGRKRVQPTTTGAEIYSTEAFVHARFEVCLRSAVGPGVVTGVFTFAPKRERTHWRELDIEFLGNRPNEVQTNVIVQTGDERKSNNEKWIKTAGRSSDFRVYSIEWTPLGIKWRIGRTLVRSIPPENMLARDFVDEPQTCRINIWGTDPTTEKWAGALNSSSLPSEAHVKWVKVWKWQKGEVFKKAWYDDFRSLDGARWRCATWSVDRSCTENNPENAVAGKGGLRLRLIALQAAES